MKKELKAKRLSKKDKADLQAAIVAGQIPEGGPPAEERTARLRTPDLPVEGIQRKGIPEIDAAAEKQQDLYATAKAAKDRYTEAAAKTLALMDEHGIRTYKTEAGKVVWVDDKRKAKIKSDNEGGDLD
jgi:hypothetical protein